MRISLRSVSIKSRVSYRDSGRSGVTKIYHVHFSLRQAIQFKYDIDEFERKAKEWVHSFAPRRDFNELKPVSWQFLTAHLRSVDNGGWTPGEMRYAAVVRIGAIKCTCAFQRTVKWNCRLLNLLTRYEIRNSCRTYHSLDTGLHGFNVGLSAHCLPLHV